MAETLEKKKRVNSPMNTMRRIQRAIDARKWLVFETCTDDWQEEGYPLKVSERWVLLHSKWDFHLDGYTLLRLEDITKIRPDARTSDSQRLLKKERVPEKVGISFDLDISTMQSILRGLRAAGENVTLHFDYPDEEIKCCYLGSPIRIWTKTASFLTIGTDAVWDPEPARVIYEEVSKLEFGDEYLNVYSKYAGKIPETP